MLIYRLYDVYMRANVSTNFDYIYIFLVYLLTPMVKQSHKFLLIAFLITLVSNKINIMRKCIDEQKQNQCGNLENTIYGSNTNYYNLLAVRIKTSVLEITSQQPPS